MLNKNLILSNCATKNRDYVGPLNLLLLIIIHFRPINNFKYFTTLICSTC